MELQFIRNATLRIRYHHQCLLLDPYFAAQFSMPSYAGKSRNPLIGLPFPPHEIINGVQMVLVSHLHSDHFDKAAQSILAKDIPLFCQPHDAAEVANMGFKSVYPVGQRIAWQGIGIQRTPGQHGSGEVLKEMGPVSGFFLEAPREPSLYWSGDTVLCDEVRELIATKQPEIIITHSCGATWGNNRTKIVMDEIQTVAVCKMAPRSVVVATHMESLDHATVSRDMLRNYARKNGIDDERLRIPGAGEILTFP